MRKPSICFCSFSIPQYKVGGSERQMWEMAKELADRGHDVHMTTARFSEDQPGTAELDGVTVHTFDRSSKPKLFYTYLRALKRADCNIYHNRAATSLTGLTALFAKFFQRTFVYTVAHEKEYTDEFLNDLTAVRRHLFLYGLRHADEVVTLSHDMQAGLEKAMDIDSTVIYSGYPDRVAPDWGEKEDLVIWIGRFVDWKRPELFLDIAEEVETQGWTFALIGYGDDEYEERLRKRAAEIDNVEYVGKVEPGDDWDWYRRAKLLVNTSTEEGFPNTFIQAWMMGTPVASLDVDPDKMIAENAGGLEMSPSSPSLFSKSLSNDELKILGRNGRTLFEHNFSLSNTVKAHLQEIYY